MTLHANPVKHRPTGRNPQASASKGKQSYLGEAEKRKAERRKETRELRDGKLHSSYSAKTGHLLGNHSASPSLGGEHWDSMDLDTPMSSFQLGQNCSLQSACYDAAFWF